MIVPTQAPLPDVLPVVRETVRSLLLNSPAYHELPREQRAALAHSMVRVCHAASELIREEMENDRQVAPRRTTRLARAQTAGQQYSGVAAERVAGTTQAILNAVSFPRFVTELINGVFKAMVDSSIQQMQSFVELLNNVSASLDGFADSNIGADRARMWLAEKYPASFESSTDEDDPRPASVFVCAKARRCPARLRCARTWDSPRTNLFPAAIPKRCCRSCAASSLNSARECFPRW